MITVAVTGFPGGLVRDRLVFHGCIPINSDITLERELKDEIYSINPDVVIHAGAYTDVDKCEKNPTIAFRVNVRGTTYLAEACERVNAKLIYLSTCHVFNGKSMIDYVENATPRPINIYGMTKWMGEVSASMITDTIIVRISKLFSAEPYRKYIGKTDLEAIVRPTFIHRNYMHIEHFSSALLEMAMEFERFPKVLNISAKGNASDYDFWNLVFHKLYLNFKKIVPSFIDDTSFVPRPHNGVLSVDAATKLGIKLPFIHDGVELLAKELQL